MSVLPPRSVQHDGYLERYINCSKSVVPYTLKASPIS
jgi:hypothetical protein